MFLSYSGVDARLCGTNLGKHTDAYLGKDPIWLVPKRQSLPIGSWQLGSALAIRTRWGRYMTGTPRSYMRSRCGS